MRRAICSPDNAYIYISGAKAYGYIIRAVIKFIYSIITALAVVVCPSRRVPTARHRALDPTDQPGGSREW